ncbi:hypothetical protein NITGR_290008 [Nitrospina gracilis 3/211]|uniref:Uncharacterized protein n=1 Tax=Nitrospina gracilis (strain 3/211) TaxID=1266370 RepID=M1ZAU7_NITG3|nr:hypothetical protein NITGR_290008 [Nitrospina gracilis 3/211]
MDRAEPIGPLRMSGGSSREFYFVSAIQGFVSFLFNTGVMHVRHLW